MDFRNICSKFDMDAIKAKFPPLPDVMTQFRLPRSMSKLKSRSKIFGASRDNVASSSLRRSSKENVSVTPTLAIPPPSNFVNHTPQRISTISSLVDQKASTRSKPPAASIKRKNPPPPQPNESFYRSAGGIEDYCPTPPSHNATERETTATTPTEDDAGKLSFSERVQKGYKDVSDFRLKHIFVKKTVVRKDGIALNHYIEQYSEDLQRQERYEEKLNRKIADDYNFEFKISRRKSEESFGISTPTDTPCKNKSKTNKKLLSEHSEDESGMELSPPNRKQGIAATRFARVRKVPLRMSLDEGEDEKQTPKRDESDVDLDEEEEELDEVVPRQNTLPEVGRLNKEEAAEKVPSPPKPKSLRQRFSILTRQMSGGQASSPELKTSRRAPLSKQETDDLDEVEEEDNAQVHTNTPSKDKQQDGKPFVVIKENFKRFQKSFKLSTTSLANPAGAESEAGDGAEKVKTSKSQQFAERLKRFRSVDNVNRQTDEEQDKVNESPLHKFTNKLQEWKKSIKKKAPSHNTDDEEAPDDNSRDKPVGTLMKKLRSIRSRKNPSTDDPDEDEEGGSSYREGFRSRAKLQLEKGVAAATHVPQMTMEKLRETKKLFRKRRENKNEKDEERKKKPKTSPSKNESDESDLDEESDHSRKPKLKSKGALTKQTPPTRHYYSSDDEDEGDDEYDSRQKGLCTVTTNMDSHGPKVMVPLARAAWTNKSIHSDSVDTQDDDDDMLPRVLLHQNNSDAFESTIIIAVTRPISRSHSPSPYITELPHDSPKISSPDTKADNWVPGRDVISEPFKRHHSKDTITSNESSKGHSRKHSMDSSSDDCWFKEVPRGISTAMGLNLLSEMDEPWKVQTSKKDEKLYKTKSIDIFEKTAGSTGMRIFDDFDDELKNMPVVKIKFPETELKIDEIYTTNNEDSFDQDSGEDMEDNADDDNSSRVTRILMQPPLIEVRDEEDESLLLSYKIKDFNLKSKESLIDPDVKESNKFLSDNSYDNDNEEDSDGIENERDEGEEDEQLDSDELENRPPSTAPSPPPSISPPPPPLPIRQPSIRLSKMSLIPPLPQHPPPPPPPEEIPPSPPKTLPPTMPQSKPPLMPNRSQAPTAPPPKVPDRTPSMSRVSKPLVKTSSLRLAYDEQVNPQDVGKVNKLISKFEPNGGRRDKPHLIPRRPFISQSSEDYSEDDEEEEAETSGDNNSEKDNNNLEREKSLEKTPTNKPRIQKSFSIIHDEIPLTSINNNLEMKSYIMKSTGSNESQNHSEKSSIILHPAPPRERAPSPPYIPTISISTLSLKSDQNANFSQASSEYGSPMASASSRICSSNDTTPKGSPKHVVLLSSNSSSSRRSRRSMTRDDEKYFSFDSDEENSYYSIGSSKSSRYIVDL